MTEDVKSRRTDDTNIEKLSHVTVGLEDLTDLDQLPESGSEEESSSMTLPSEETVNEPLTSRFLPEDFILQRSETDVQTSDASENRSSLKGLKEFARFTKSYLGEGRSPLSDTAPLTESSSEVEEAGTLMPLPSEWKVDQTNQLPTPLVSGDQKGSPFREPASSRSRPDSSEPREIKKASEPDQFS